MGSTEVQLTKRLLIICVVLPMLIGAVPLMAQPDSARPIFAATGIAISIESAIIDYSQMQDTIDISLLSRGGVVGGFDLKFGSESNYWPALHN